MLFNELYKIRSVERFLNLNISREHELQNIVTLAAEACQAHAAFLVFLDGGKLKYHFKFGYLANDLNVEDTFWDEQLTPDEVLVIPDMLQHPRLASHPLATSPPHIRFYAGTPLITHDGQNIGSLYVLSPEAKTLSERRRHMLQLLSRQAVTMVEFELGIGELKQQFMEVKNAENKLRSFFESSKSSHLLIGRNMEVITFNKTFYDVAYAIFGKAITAGVKATDFIYAPYVDDFVKNVQTALTGETVQHERLIEFEGIDPRWAKITYNPTYDGDGNIIGVSFNSTDITKRKQNEQKILQQNEALRKIAFLQSHELRKPVASILGLMHLLKLEETSTNSAILDMMEKAVLELDNTIHHIVQSTETQTEFDPLSENFTL